MGDSLEKGAFVQELHSWSKGSWTGGPCEIVCGNGTQLRPNLWDCAACLTTNAP